MSDIADEAFELEGWERTLALKNRKLPDPSSPVSRNGYCGEKLQPGTSYCSPECREDAERFAWAERQR